MCCAPKESLVARGPPASSAKASQPTARQQRPTSCRFSSLAMVSYVQQEVLYEGVLHVSAGQVGACLDQRFADLEGVWAQAPAAPALSYAPSLGALLAETDSPAGSAAEFDISDSDSFSHHDRLLKEALCLATPPDEVAEEAPASRPLRTSSTPFSAAGEQAASRSRSCRMQAAAELLSAEAVSHRAFCAHSTNEFLKAAAVRRQRRRAVLRVVRRGRAAAATTLQALRGSTAAQLLARISGAQEDSGEAAAAEPVMMKSRAGQVA